MASLLDRNIKSRLLLRDTEKATALFGEQDPETLQVQEIDSFQSNTILHAYLLVYYTY